MNILIDNEIPHATFLFSSLGKVTLIATEDIATKNLNKADILITRSITKVNFSLLNDTPIRIIASPTSGIDHFDKTFLKKHQITYFHAPACNARAVAEYIVCLMAYLEKNRIPSKLPTKRAAIIGVGQVGTEVAEILNILGYELMFCDPVRAHKEANFPHIPLKQIKDVDIITLHTPLTHEDLYPTYHLVDENFIQQQHPQTVIINTARGMVIDPQVIPPHHFDYLFCNDVHASEPLLKQEIWRYLTVGTPHIAGHTLQAKLRGSEMIAHQLANFLEKPPPPPITYPQTTINLKDVEIHSWQDFCLFLYNPFKESQILLNKLNSVYNHTLKLDEGRKTHTARHEFAFINFENKEKIKNSLPLQDQVILQQLGFAKLFI